MSLLLELSGNKAKARAAAKELTVQQLENLLVGLTNALGIKKEEATLNALEEAERKEKAEGLAKLIAESGLTLDEIATLAAPRAIAKPVKAVEPKFRIEVKGEEHLWTGRGRTPKAFQEYFDAGNSKDSCAI